MMSVAGVMVKVSGPDPSEVKSKGKAFFKSDHGITTLSGSGSLVWQEAQDKTSSTTVEIISSASLVAPFLPLSQENGNQSLVIPGTLVQICVESRLQEPVKWIEARVERIITLGPVGTAVSRFLGVNASIERGITVGSVVVLSCPRAEFAHIEPNTMRYSHEIQSEHIQPHPLHRGEVLTIQSSPFGLVSQEMFQNTITSGVVCNTIPCKYLAASADLVLTDARCLPGSEGGPVWNSSGRWVGVVAPVLKRFDGTALELSLVIPVELFLPPTSAPVLAINAKGSSKPLTSVSFSLPNATSNPVATSSETNTTFSRGTSREQLTSVQQAVALVQVGGSWGTGVAIAKNGYLVTCAHVLMPHMVFNEKDNVAYCSRTIYVTFRDDAQLKCPSFIAKALFVSRGPVDVALLQLEQVFHSESRSWLRLETNGSALAEGKEMPLCPEVQYVRQWHQGAHLGETVYALGYPLFAPSSNLGSTATRGSLSKIVRDSNDVELVLQSSAHVFGGHSGGLLVDSKGRALGMLTSNARHADGSIIPSINFSIPASALGVIFAAVNSTVSGEIDLEVLRDTFDSPNELLSRLLSLQSLDDLLRESIEKPLGSDGEELLQGSHFGDFLKQFESESRTSKL